MIYKLINSKHIKTSAQFFLSGILIAIVSLICYNFSEIIGYKSVALLLMMCLSILAVLFDILPVLFASILSAFIWNYFFIPPVFTLHINSAEDLLIFSMYFVIAFINAVLTYKIRQEERKNRDKVEHEKTIALYNTLFNSLSHELKTPIATVIGAVDTLKDNQTNLTITNQNELLNQIELAGIRLNRQVENLLNMSRLESGIFKIKLDWCDLHELIHDLIHKSICKEGQKINFDIVHAHLLYWLDRGLLEQILNNLLDNAINYTPQNSIISIHVFYTNPYCIIEISDNGNGINPEEFSLIFDKFYRGNNAKSNGTGLGLSIVKGFVEAQNGNIVLEKNDEGGLKFIIKIPTQVMDFNSLKNE